MTGRASRGAGIGILALGLLLADDAALADAPFEIKGEWRQGNVILGRVQPGEQVSFNGRALRLDDEGRFIIGLDRDEKPEGELRVGEAIYRYRIEARSWDVQRVDGLPPDKVTPPAGVLKRIEREQALLRTARRHDSALGGFAQSFAWPCEGRISGVFGSQRILNGTPKQPHYGVDVAVPEGTPVKAPADGVVTVAHNDMYYTGGTLMIDHGHGLSSVMVHLSKLRVKAGEAVKQGQVVALSGMTGRATGPHLHWGVSWFDSRIDPMTLVPAVAGAAQPQPR